MSYNNKEVTKMRPCPICGHTDYCSWFNPESEDERIVCKRSDMQEDIMGLDGRAYKFIHLSQTQQNTVYQEMSLYMSRREREKDEWMRQNQKGPYNPNKKKGENWTPSEMANTTQKPMAQAKAIEWVEVDKVEPLSHKTLDAYNRVLLSLLVLDEVHYQYLKKEGWSDELIDVHGIRSFPERDVIRFKYKHTMNFSRNPYRKTIAKRMMEILGVDNLRGYPGAYIDNKGDWTFAGPKGILFPVYDVDGYLYGFRIRMDFMDVERPLEHNRGLNYYVYDGVTWYFKPLKGFFYLDEKSQEVFPKDGGYHTEDGRFKSQRGKYRPLTSFHQKEDRELAQKHLIVNSYDSGCAMESGMSLYFQPGIDNPTVCYLTEGEKKGIFANTVMQAPYITFPGVDAWGSLFQGEEGTRPIDKLKSAGVQLFIIAYDADKETNANVLRAQQNVVNALKTEGFQVGLANWDQRYGKGLDDLLVRGKFPEFQMV